MIKIQKFKTLKMTRRGLSLIELLIVMSIITIMTAVTVPLISYFLSPSLKLSSSTSAVMGKLRQAQEQAITTQIAHSVRFTPGTPGSMQLIEKTTPDNILETVEISRGITLTTILQNNEVVFAPDGGLSSVSNPGFVKLSFSDATQIHFFLIEINSIGIIKLHSSYSSPTPTPTPTPTETPTPTPTPTPTSTPTPTPTPSSKTPYPSPSYVISPTPTLPPEEP